MSSSVKAVASREYLVGGVRLPRPFRVRRLGHFGINVNDPEVSRTFYEDLLGLRITDRLDLTGRLPEEELVRHGPRIGYFTRCNAEHHSFVFFPRRALSAVYGFPSEFPEVTTNQITWQVGSLREVVDGFEYFRSLGLRIHRSGRDLPGSNWNVYPFDPDGHVNELFYGIELLGWNGQSKPGAMHETRWREPPPLPIASELSEVQAARERGVDLGSGWRQAEPRPEQYDVGGISLGRPFKIVRVGPVRIFVDDIERALAFYRDTIGLMLTEEVVWNGHRCLFLRANTEHHSLALYPKACAQSSGSAAIPPCSLSACRWRTTPNCVLRAISWPQRACRSGSCPGSCSLGSTTRASRSIRMAMPYSSTSEWSRSGGTGVPARPPCARR